MNLCESLSVLTSCLDKWADVSPSSYGCATPARIRLPIHSHFTLHSNSRLSGCMMTDKLCVLAYYTMIDGPLPNCWSACNTKHESICI